MMEEEKLFEWKRKIDNFFCWFVCESFAMRLKITDGRGKLINYLQKGNPDDG
jgi:hypothetical protein